MLILFSSGNIFGILSVEVITLRSFAWISLRIRRPLECNCGVTQTNRICYYYILIPFLRLNVHLIFSSFFLVIYEILRIRNRWNDEYKLNEYREYVLTLRLKNLDGDCRFIDFSVCSS